MPSNTFDVINSRSIRPAMSRGCLPLILMMIAAVALIPNCALAQGKADGFLNIDQLSPFLKAGSLGFAMLGMILAYRLLSEKRNREGLAFLAVVLATSFVFLYAEHTSVEIVRYPHAFAAGIPGVAVTLKGQDLKFDQGIEELSCAPAMKIMVDAEPLLGALRDANARFTVAAKMRSVPESHDAGIDPTAGDHP